jgi:hypothetical protein
MDLPLQQAQDKRQCIRQPEEVGELTDEAGSRPKGMSIYLLDLAGRKLFTRNKTDLAQWEEDLGFIFRTMDKTKMDYSVSTDLILQVEVYRSMVCEQGDTRADDRHTTFIACGLISRVHRLAFFTKTEKLKLFLVGSVLKQGSSDTLALEDFVTGEKITSKPTACPSNNSGLFSALRNFQKMMPIVFSDFYEKCLDPFIKKLEGAVRPMELVPSDLLKHSVELTLRNVFRIIRSVKSATMPETNVEGPENCARFIMEAFKKTANDLSDHAIMSKQDLFYRVKLSRHTEGSGVSRAEATIPPKVEKGVAKPSVKYAEQKAEEKPVGATKRSVRDIWANNWQQYTCGFGKDCTFTHMSVAGKSDQKLLEVAATMPPPMRQDIIRANNARK